MLAADVMFDVAEINPPVNILPPVMLPLRDAIEPMWLAPDTIVVARTFPPATFAALVMFEVALINPLVSKFPPVTFAITDTIEPIWLAPDTIVVARTLPPDTLADDIILPLAEINPVTYSPVVAKTATFEVPATLIVALAFEDPIANDVAPKLIEFAR